MRFGFYFLIGVLLGAAAWHFLVPPVPATAAANALSADVTAQRAADPSAPPRVAAPTVLRDFFVRLTDEENGKPVAGASLVTSVDETVAADPLVVASDAEGIALWRVAAGAGAEVRVDAAGFASVLFLAKAGRHGTRVDPLTVGLERAATLDGIARDEQQLPLAGARIVLKFEHQETLRPRSNFGRVLSRPERRTTTTDAAGHFVFDLLPPDVELELRLIKAGATAECDVTEVWLDPGERHALDWALRGHAKVKGRVVAPGAEPVGGAWVCVGQPPWPRCVETTANALGEFALDDAPAGAAVLRIEAKGEHFATIAQPIALSVNEERRLVVELPPAAPLIVRAVDAAGKPASALQAKVFSLVAGQSFVETSTSEPRVLLGHVPLGDVTVRVDPFAQGALAGAEVTFHHDGQHECVVTLPAGGSASGRIVDARDGKAPVAATVTALRRGAESSTEALRSVFFTPAPSTFTVDHLEPGTYDFIAADDDGRIGLLAGVEITAGAPRTGLVIPAAPAAILDIEAPAAELAPGSADHIVFQIRSGTARVGTAAIKAHGRTHVLVPPGPLTVELRHGRELRATQDVVGRKGEQTRVKF